MRFRLAVVALLLLSPAVAQAASCRNYGPEVQAAIKSPVESLRLVEHEAADRIAGLDTRPFDQLLGQARAAVAVIADKSGLDKEDALKRCRNYIRPIRRTCAAAGEALVAVIASHATGTSDKASKQVYATAMTQCERFMGLAPLKTALRTAIE